MKIFFIYMTGRGMLNLYKKKMLIHIRKKKLYIWQGEGNVKFIYEKTCKQRVGLWVKIYMVSNSLKMEKKC